MAAKTLREAVLIGTFGTLDKRYLDQVENETRDFFGHEIMKLERELEKELKFDTDRAVMKLTLKALFERIFPKEGSDVS